MSSNRANWLSRRAQANRYGRTTRTIRRWETDPDLNYPPGIMINGQSYRREDHLDAWDAERAKVQAPVDLEKTARVIAGAKAKRAVAKSAATTNNPEVTA